MEPVWISFATAAEILGCSVRTVQRYAYEGRFIRPDRPELRGHPSLRLDSVLDLREQLAADRTERERRRHQQASGPPDREHRWLRSPQVAEMLGVSRTRVDQLVREGRIPYTAKGKRRWYRAQDITVLRKARAFRAMVDADRRPAVG